MRDSNSDDASSLIEDRTTAAAGKHTRGDLNTRTRILKFPRRAYLALSNFPVRTLWIANDRNRFAFGRRAVIHFQCCDFWAGRVRLQQRQVGVHIGRDHAFYGHVFSFESPTRIRLACLMTWAFVMMQPV